jgi:hypothetical protein
MKNDLTTFERNLLRVINVIHNKHYNYKNLMEWNTDKTLVESNLEEDEVLYHVMGVYVAIKENNNLN